MVDVEQQLQRLRTADVQHLPVRKLNTDAALQPREMRMVPFRDQGRVESRSEAHIGSMRLALEASPSIQLEPVLVADLDSRLYVVDGHHRLNAYERAKREAIPARVLAMTKPTAALVSKVVNCSDRALEMHREQRFDAAWQYLAGITRRGTVRPPKEHSCRKLAGRFGIGHATVARMLRMLPKVNPSDWNSDALDDGTGFPRWRYVREQGAGWRDMKELMNAEQLVRHEAEKLARRLGTLLEKATPEGSKLALHILANEKHLHTNNQDIKDLIEATEESYGF